MSRSKNNIKSTFISLFSRRDKPLPEDDVTFEIAGTLEEISRQVKKEATENKLLEDDFFSPTHVMRPKAGAAEAKAAAAPGPKAKIVRRCRLTPDQYENIIENSLSALDMACQIIDRNRATTAYLKKAAAE
jgi:hypothetical protein